MMRLPRLRTCMAIASILMLAVVATATFFGQFLSRDKIASGQELLSVSPMARGASTINGQTSEPAHVRLFLNFALAATADSALPAVQRHTARPTSKATEPPYQFSFDLSRLAGYKLVPDSPDPGALAAANKRTPVDYFSSAVIIASTNEGPLKITDRWEKAISSSSFRTEAPRFFREINLTVSSERLRYTARFTFEPSDPVLRLFLHRELNEDAFLQRLLRVTVGSIGLYDAAERRTLRFKTERGATIVTVKGDSASNLSLQSRTSWNSLTVFRGQVPGESGLRDTLILHSSDRPVLSAEPSWSTAGNSGSLVWYGGPRSSEITVYLDSSSITSLRLLRDKLGTINPTSTYWQVAQTLESALLLVLPLLIVLVLLKRPDLRGPDIRRVCASLLCACVAPSGAYLFYSSLQRILLIQSSYSGAIEYWNGVLSQFTDLAKAASFAVGILGAVALLLVAVAICKWVAAAPASIAWRVLGIEYGVAAVVAVAEIPILRLNTNAAGNWISPLLVACFGILLFFNALSPSRLEAVVRRHRPSLLPWVSIVISVCVISLAFTPFHATSPDESATVSYVGFGRMIEIEFSVGLLSQAVFLLLFVIGGPTNGEERRPRNLASAFAIACSALIAGTDVVDLIPLNFLMGLLVFRWVLRDGRALAAVNKLQKTLPRTENGIRREFRRLRDAQAATDGLKGLRSKLLAGDLSPSDYDARVALVKKESQDDAVTALLGSDLGAADVAFGFGESPNAAHNGVVAAKYGLVVGALLFLFAVPQYLEGISNGAEPISVLTGVAYGLSSQSAQAFLFGYFFRYLRGSMGVTKALLFAVAGAASSLPTLLIYSTKSQIISQTLSIIIFFGVIGTSFDFRSFRRLKVAMQPREILDLAGLGSFAAAGTLALTTLGTIVTGQLKTLFPVVLQAFFPPTP